MADNSDERTAADVEGSSWMIDWALSAEGLNAQQKAVVEAAIPDAQALASLINSNMPLINQAVALYNQSVPFVNAAWPHVQKVVPAVQIICDALARKNAQVITAGGKTGDV